MTTTISIIENELKEKGFPTTGIYESLPKMVLSAVNDIKYFGISSLEKRNLGAGVKKIVLELAARDTRKAVIRNGKTILN